MSSPNLVARNIKSLPPLFISLDCIATITMMKPTIIDPNGLTGYSASFHGLVIMGDISPLGYNGGHFQGSFETTIRPVQRFSGQNGCVLFKLTLCAMCMLHSPFLLSNDINLNRTISIMEVRSCPMIQITLASCCASPVALIFIFHFL